MKAGHVFIILCCIISIKVKAQIKPDTLDTVVINERYWEGYESAIFTDKIDPEKVSNPGGNAGYILREKGGHNFVPYGINGIVTPRLRGTNPEHTAVLWNGINVNHAALGQSNAFNTPISSSNDIALHLGGSSSLFGTGAIAGVIQFNDHINFQRENNFTAQLGYGSFGRIHSNIGYKNSGSRFSTAIGFYRNQAENDFDYINTTDYRKPHVRQNNAAFNQSGISGHLAYKLTNNSQLRIHAWIHDGFSEVQPPMTNRSSEGWQKDQTHRYKLSYMQVSQIGLIEFSGYYTSDAINFNDQVSVVERIGFRANWTKSLFNEWSISAGVNNDFFIPHIENYPTDASENRTSFYALNNIKIGNLNIGLNLRYTIVDGFKAPFAPAFKMDYTLFENQRKQLSLIGSYSEDFRIPTLNERFWQPNANPNILPETSRQLEMGMRGVINGWNIKAAVFQLNINNVVRWIESDSLWSDYSNRWYTNIFTPVNFNSLESRGVNVSLESRSLTIGSISVVQRLTINHCHSRTIESELERRSLYIPENTLSANTEVIFPKGFDFNINWHWFDESPTSIRNLDSYSLLNFIASKNLILKDHEMQILLRLNNALNTSYQTFVNRAMPGMNWMVSARLKLHYHD